ncbi:hypothetical protein LSH36_334g02011 [Paralvinella palmiformis]|uniref:Uncharacterized protein n=1 Tax=Paralvinella palmiformis TaxID=53620 RepID=A0AAD9JFL0_9ANNE|nr:hypothetical protein LSH36_334g02011 [Paralvinella palmiformis]
MSSLKDKVVVITGASSGIGAASAVKFAKHGCRLVITGRNQQGLNEVADRCVAEVIVRGDLKEDDAVREIITTTLDKFGTINVLFNNAGSVSMVDGALSVNGKVEALDEIPGFVKTGVSRILGEAAEMFWKQCEIVTPLEQKLSTSDEIADVVIFLASDLASSISGSNLVCDRLSTLASQVTDFTKFNPGFVKTRVSRILGEAAEMFWKQCEIVTPLEQKLSTSDEIADVVIFLASDLASSISGSNLVCDRLSTLASQVTDFTKFNPGFVKTRVSRILGEAAEMFWKQCEIVTPLEQKLSTSDEIADVVIFLASDLASSISGSNLVCDRLSTLASQVTDFTKFK